MKAKVRKTGPSSWLGDMAWLGIWLAGRIGGNARDTVVFEQIIRDRCEPSGVARLQDDGAAEMIADDLEEFGCGAVVEAQAGCQLHENRTELVAEGRSLLEEGVESARRDD